MFKLHAEFTAGELLDYGALYFYAVFFTHSVRRFCAAVLFSKYRSGAGPLSLVDQGRPRTGN
jgi:hypothetical protein